MDSATFQWVFDWVVAHGYTILFLTMLVEGPVVTFAAGFAAALGYFDIILVLILSFFGDLVSDIIFYGVGYWGRGSIADRYGHRLGLTKERIEKIEHAIKDHVVKSLVILKFVPVLPTFGLLVTGSLRIPLKRFITVVTLVIIPRTLFFGLAGFYFGQAYATFLPKVKNVEDTLLAILIAGLIFYGVYRIIAQRVSKISDM